MNHAPPYIVAGLGIPSCVFLICWAIRDWIAAERGDGSLRRDSHVPSLDSLLDECDWDFQCGPRLPR